MLVIYQEGVAMAEVADEDLRWLTSDEEMADPGRDRGPRDGHVHADPAGTESLRGAFVEAFNAHDLDRLLDLLTEDVEWGDAAIEGRRAVAGELTAVWERSPDVVLTRAFDDDGPCAVAWRPDEDGAWVRVAVLCFDVDDDLISLVEIPDDAEALATVTAEDPSVDEPDEWLHWEHDDPSVSAD